MDTAAINNMDKVQYIKTANHKINSAKFLYFVSVSNVESNVSYFEGHAEATNRASDCTGQHRIKASQRDH